MTEKQFKELLKQLNIGENRSYIEIRELLDAKLSEYLDRQDESAEEMVSDIQDALDYAEEQINRMGGGIALPPEKKEEKENPVNTDLLKEAAKNNKKTAVEFQSESVGQTSSAGQTGGNSAINSRGKAWFYSLYGDQKVDDMFDMAEGDLRSGDFDHAGTVFDMILKIEVANAGAYMGKVLSTYHLKEPKEIASCYKAGLEKDADLKRAENCGSEKQKKYIRDVMEERRKAVIYKDAEKILLARNDVSELQYAASQFESLGSYRDAVSKADICRNSAEKLRTELEKREEEKKRLEEEKRRQEEERKKQEEKKQREWARKERRQKQKKALIRIAIVIMLFSALSGVLYYESSGVVSGFKTYFPNMAYTKDVHIYNTKVPYFISFVPINQLYIEERAENLGMIFMPFGAKEIEYRRAMKHVTIPKNCKSVRINCEKLTSLEIPDGVFSLYLYNIPSELTILEIPDSVRFLWMDNVSDELAANMVLSSNLVSFSIGRSMYGDDKTNVPLTDKGLSSIKLPDSLQYFKLSYCNQLGNIEIENSLKGLYIDGMDGLQSLTISGNVERIYMPSSIKKLTITGAVETFEGGTIESCSFENSPENLQIEYTGKELFTLPQNLKYLELEAAEWENADIESLVIPESAENIIINDKELIGHKDPFPYEIFGGNKEKTWPESAIEAAIEVEIK